jgi:hypothetical protein
MQTATAYEAFSWNYVSIGMDARAAHGFHTLRDSKPALAFSRTANKAWYVYYGCASGWFCGAGPLSKQVRLELLGPDGTWKETRVPASVTALIFLNLQSYGGGRDIWHHDKAVRLSQLNLSWPCQVLNSLARMLLRKRPKAPRYFVVFPSRRAPLAPQLRASTDILGRTCDRFW